MFDPKISRNRPFLSEIAPDLLAGRPNLSEHRSYQALPLLTRHLPLHSDSQLPQLVKKISLGQGALSERGPDLHELASLFVRPTPNLWDQNVPNLSDFASKIYGNYQGPYTGHYRSPMISVALLESLWTKSDKSQ